jgi:hypothetical protein
MEVRNCLRHLFEMGADMGPHKEVMSLSHHEMRADTQQGIDIALRRGTSPYFPPISIRGH